MHCVAHFAEKTCAERPANGDLETPWADSEKGKNILFLWTNFFMENWEVFFGFTLFQKSIFCPKLYLGEKVLSFWHGKLLKIRVTYFLQIRVSWCFKDGFVKIYFFDKTLNFNIMCYCLTKRFFHLLKIRKSHLLKKVFSFNFFEFKREDIFCVTTKRYEQKCILHQHHYNQSDKLRG